MLRALEFKERPDWWVARVRSSGPVVRANVQGQPAPHGLASTPDRATSSEIGVRLPCAPAPLPPMLIRGKRSFEFAVYPPGVRL